MPKPFAAFDVDGTIFKSSLAEKIVEGGIEAGIFAAKAFATAHERRRQWQRNNNEGIYQSYLHHLVGAFVIQMAGVEVERFEEVASQVMQQHSVRKFAFSRRLLEALHDSHSPIAISGSPLMLLEPFLGDLHFESIYGSTFEIEDGKFTGKATSVGDKAEILRDLVIQEQVTQESSIAIGDTISDKSMLEYANVPIIFNGGRTLTNYGKPRGWTRVNEHKDQITVLQKDERLGIYTERELKELLEDLQHAA